MVDISVDFFFSQCHGGHGPMAPSIYRVSTIICIECSNLYLGDQLQQNFETGINVKLNTSSSYGIQDAVEFL